MITADYPKWLDTEIDQLQREIDTIDNDTLPNLLNLSRLNALLMARRVYHQGEPTEYQEFEPCSHCRKVFDVLAEPLIEIDGYWLCPECLTSYTDLLSRSA